MRDGRTEWQTMDAAARARLPDLIHHLEEELKPLWQDLVDMLGITDIDPFAERAMALGTEYAYPPLTSWAERVLVQANTFQVDILPKTLDEFSEHIENLKAIVAV